MTGLPNFSKKKNAENRWSLLKDGLQGRQLTDALRVLKIILTQLMLFSLSNFHLKLLEVVLGIYIYNQKG